MATQEIGLNEALAAAGIAAWETDLAELIVQLGHDKPSHILVPAIHRNRAEIREIFLREMAAVGLPAPADLTDSPAALAEAARRHLRRKFLDRAGRDLRRELRGRVDRDAVGGRVRGQRADVHHAAADADHRDGHREAGADLGRPRGVPAAAAAVVDRRADEPVHVDVVGGGRGAGVPPGAAGQRADGGARRSVRPRGAAVHPVLGLPERVPGVRADRRARVRVGVPGADRGGAVAAADRGRPRTRPCRTRRRCAGPATTSARWRSTSRRCSCTCASQVPHPAAERAVMRSVAYAMGSPRRWAAALSASRAGRLLGAPAGPDPRVAAAAVRLDREPGPAACRRPRASATGGPAPTEALTHRPARPPALSDRMSPGRVPQVRGAADRVARGPAWIRPRPPAAADRGEQGQRPRGRRAAVSSARDEVLSRIRRALADRPVAPEVPRAYRRAGDLDQAGAARPAGGPAGRLQGRGPPLLPDAACSTPSLDALSARGAAPDRRAARPALGSARRGGRRRPDRGRHRRLDGVVTACAVAVAETGTIVLDSVAGPGPADDHAGARLPPLRRPGRPGRPDRARGGRPARPGPAADLDQRPVGDQRHRAATGSRACTAPARSRSSWSADRWLLPDDLSWSARRTRCPPGR